jgi:hypothetical protein
MLGVDGPAAPRGDRRTMDSVAAAAAGGFTRRNARTRAMSIIAAVALVLAAFILIQKPAEASPAVSVSVAAVVAGAASVGSATPQLGNLSAFICALLQSIFSAFLNSPFFAFLGAFFNNILDAFGCGDISGT